MIAPTLPVRSSGRGGIEMRWPSGPLLGSNNLPDKWAASINGWTHSWSIARKLYSFVTQKLGADSTYIARSSSRPPAYVNGSKGDLVFYEWGNQDGQLIDHVNVRVAAGKDPHSPFTGDRVNGHNTNRQKAIWHLWPYNANRTTTFYYLVRIPSGA
ncbi:amidase domain-containing protein [Nocardioides sp. L-11A]|uniref:amidase domain-containing protein n=1 Tax=Nocardioides sp. L-11A TaxID=3043848 RepID=UPI00249BE7B7|nr:amidase domain-containing protein [Nocardioides sp. L-11A]